MFDRIFVEKEVQTNPRLAQILAKIPGASEVEYISKVEDYFGRVKRPYLQKRENLNLYIGNKKGQLVKEAPDAYGLAGEPHYYFIHAYNCIYECQYCYLQGHFNSPDIVLFLNHEEIVKEMKNTLSKYPKTRVWFHAGEFSDSLALSHISGELEVYWDFFQNNPWAYLELRTKSVNTKALEKLPPLKNAITSFSLMPQWASKHYDLKTPGSKARLKAIERLAKLGHSIGIHMDPIIMSDTVIDDYQQLFKELMEVLPEKQLAYISFGVVRFTKDVYREMERNYPKSHIHQQELVKSFDNKVRYNRPTRLWLLKEVEKLAKKVGIKDDKIYLCMEDQ